MLAPPKTADELLAYARENKNRFFYARPANSGPGRTLLMGLPYILGDSDPKSVEIRAGLTAGERYVAENSFVVKAEMGKGEADHD